MTEPGPIIAVCWGGDLPVGSGPGGDPAAAKAAVQAVLDDIKAEGAKFAWRGNRLVDARWSEAEGDTPASIHIHLEEAPGCDTTVDAVRDFITEARRQAAALQAEGRLL